MTTDTRMIKIEPFHESLRKEVNALMDEIAREFSEPISSPEIDTNPGKVLDKYWAATINGALAGTVGVLKLKSGNAVLKSMFVGDEFRGVEKGISNLLLQTLIEWCKNQEVSQIFLGTMSQFKAAHRFYEKNEFRQVEKSELPEDFIHNPVDDVFYVKSITTRRPVKLEFRFRTGTINDLDQLIRLAMCSWSHFEEVLTEEHWKGLKNTLENRELFISLLNKSHCIVCETGAKEIIGMAFLVPNGNPDDIYEAHWAHLRFVSVHPDYGGQGIGKGITKECLKHAKETNEKTVALHTSEIMGKAMGIYQGLGFSVLRELEPRLGKRYWLFLLEL